MLSGYAIDWFRNCVVLTVSCFLRLPPDIHESRPYAMRDVDAAGGIADVPNLVDERTFRLLLHLEVQKAIRLRYCVAVVLLDIDPTNGEEQDAKEHEITRHLAQLATRRLRGTDVVATLPPSSIAFLLIDAETPSLPGIVYRAAEPWSGGPLSVYGREWRIRWSAGGGCYPLTATTAGGLLEQAHEHMVRARAAGTGRVSLPT